MGSSSVATPLSEDFTGLKYEIDLPDTDSVVRRALSSGPNQSVWLTVGVLGLLVGAIVMVSPSRTARRS